MYYLITVNNRIEKLANLNQIYGFLVGSFPNYRKHHPSIYFFRRWFFAIKRREGKKKFDYKFENTSFSIEIIKSSPLRQAPQNEK